MMEGMWKCESVRNVEMRCRTRKGISMSMGCVLVASSTGRSGDGSSYLIRKFTYNQTKGIANIKESSLSRKPPWPGMMLPLSFTPAMRLSLDSRRSPNVPASAEIKEIPKRYFQYKSGCKKRVMTTTERIIPPVVPSHVFFGDILD